jgi:hypothetical protein
MAAPLLAWDSSKLRKRWYRFFVCHEPFRMLSSICGPQIPPWATARSCSVYMLRTHALGGPRPSEHVCVPSPDFSELLHDAVQVRRAAHSCAAESGCMREGTGPLSSMSGMHASSRANIVHTGCLQVYLSVKIYQRRHQDAVACLNRSISVQIPKVTFGTWALGPWIPKVTLGIEQQHAWIPKVDLRDLHPTILPEGLHLRDLRGHWGLEFSCSAA